MILLLAACATGTFKERQQALCHPEAGCVERLFWMDSDGDGWGDAEVSQPFTWPEEGWIDNARDCDDDDADVGARLGGGCPQGRWATDGQVEWLFSTQMLGLYQARDTCGPAGFGGELGGTIDLLEHTPPGWDGWLGESVSDLHPSWGPLVEELPDGDPVIGGSGNVDIGSPDDSEAFVCSRPRPDPDDYAALVQP